MEENKEPNLEDLKKRLEDCQKLRDEYLAGWQRARADLLNYKKEEMEKLGELIKYANVGTILKILPILDNFDVALKNMPFAELRSLRRQGETGDEVLPQRPSHTSAKASVHEGFAQIKKQFQDFLKEQDIEEIKSVGEKFDPNLHEVIEEVSPSEASAEGGESGTVLEEIQKGYTINGRLLRPAKVKVAK